MTNMQVFSIPVFSKVLKKAKGEWEVGDRSLRWKIADGVCPLPPKTPTLLGLNNSKLSFF